MATDLLLPVLMTGPCIVKDIFLHGAVGDKHVTAKEGHRIMTTPSEKECA